jgi:hypothetical protein
MLKAEQGKELIIKVLNDIGVLADISRIVADKGISIRAVSCWVEGQDGVIHLVTDDNLRAGDALRKSKFNVREAGVVIAELPHKPGMLKHLTETLKAAKIDIHHLYASAHSADAKCLTVFSTSDNDRAIVEINK